MGISRRFVVLSLAGSALLRANGPAQQFPDEQPQRRLPMPDVGNEDKRLPNGKSQADAIAKEKHEQALKDAKELITVAEQLRDELQKAGDYVVPVSSVRKTEQNEKLAKKIRSRLQS
jgi:hypothetical protein